MARTSGLGYYSGLKDAMELRSDMQERQSMQQLRQMQIQKEEAALMEEQQTKALMQNAFRAMAPDRVAAEKVQGEADISNQFIEVGKAILGVDPKFGLEVIQEGRALKKSAIEGDIQNLQLKSAQMEMQGAIAAQVHDEASLAEALPALSQAGIVVPERYRKWTPETKEWLARRAAMSSNWLTANSLKIKERQLELTEEENNSKQLDRIEKRKLADRKEQRMRNQYTSGKSASKPQPLNNLKVEVQRLNTYDEFDSLPNKIKPSVAQDVYYIAAAKAKQDPDRSYDAIMEEARQEVLGRIDPETGEYRAFSAGDGGSNEPAKPTSQEEFNALPSGSLYVNPKDGKTYRKK